MGKVNKKWSKSLSLASFTFIAILLLVLLTGTAQAAMELVRPVDGFHGYYYQKNPAIQYGTPGHNWNDWVVDPNGNDYWWAPVLTADTPVIDFNWGAQGWIPLYPMGAWWYGTINVAEDGYYVLSSWNDDGIWVWIDKGTNPQPVYHNRGGWYGGYGTSNPIYLTAGYHSIEVKYFEDFEWTSPIGVSLVSLYMTRPDYRISIAPPSATNLVGDSETFTVLLETTTDGTNWSPASSKTVSLSITSPAYFVSIGGVPASGQTGSGVTDTNGELAVVVKSDSATTATLNATFQTSLGGTTLTRSDTATKTWNLVKTFELTVNPPIDGVTYYASYSTDGGTNWTTLNLTQVGTSNMFKAQTGETGPTSMLWTFIAKIGTNTVWQSSVFGPESLTTNTTNSYDLNYQIVIIPPSATNYLGEEQGHTFTVTVSEAGTNAPLANVVVYLSTDFGTLSSASITTDSSGQATFSINSSTVGTASIKAWIDMLGGTSGSFDVGEVYNTATKIWQGGSISGFKFDDRNTNGIWDKDQGEPPLERWLIILDGPIHLEMRTRADGSYEFSDLPPGDYILTEETRDLIINPDGSVVEPGWFNTVAPSPIHLNPGENKTDQNFGNKQYGWIWGRVYDAISGVGKEGVRIDLLEAGDYTTTNQNGYYYFYKLIPNGTSMFPSPTYTVEITLPPGYWAPEGTRFVKVENGKGTQVDWPIWPSPTGDSPRTIGYWKNWQNPNHCTKEQMEVMIAWIKVTSGLFPDLTVDNLVTYLTITKYSMMQDKARAQLIATWLNIASGKLGMGEIVDLSPIANWSQVITTPDGGSQITVYDLIQQIDEYFKNNTLTSALWEIVKNILDALNNGLLFV